MDRYTFEFVMKVDDDTFINNKLLFDFLYKDMKPKYNDKNRGFYGGLLFTFYSANILGTRFLPIPILSVLGGRRIIPLKCLIAMNMILSAIHLYIRIYTYRNDLKRDNNKK